jgi:Flp pilus assembly protein TadG
MTPRLRACLTRLRRGIAWAAAEAERGAVMFWVIPVMLGVIAMAGLVVDGGTAIAARQHAADLAQQAARAGADALAPVSLHAAEPSQLTADPGAAMTAADKILAAGGVAGTVTVDGDAVTVSVTVHQQTQILSAFGLTAVSGSATSTATALHGTTTGGS